MLKRDRSNGLDAADGASALWQQLGRMVRERRQELDLTHRELAEQAKLNPRTVSRIEQGRPTTRHTSSWSKLELVFDWPRGFIEDFVSGKIAAQEGRFAREPISDVNELVTSLVEDILMTVAPDTPLAEIVRIRARAKATMREYGFLPPEDPEPESDISSDTPNG